MTFDNILRFSQAKAEPDWLVQRRQDAFKKIDELELPRIFWNR